MTDDEEERGLVPGVGGLEPTKEQERRIVRMMDGFGSASAASDAGVAWDMIRDMVLEAAARAIEREGRRHEGQSMMGHYAASACQANAAVVRAMKGEP